MEIGRDDRVGRSHERRVEKGNRTAEHDTQEKNDEARARYVSKVSVGRFLCGSSCDDQWRIFGRLDWIWWFEAIIVIVGRWPSSLMRRHIPSGLQPWMPRLIKMFSRSLCNSCPKTPPPQVSCLDGRVVLSLHVKERFQAACMNQKKA